MPSSSPGGSGGVPTGAQPARAAAATVRRKSRRLVPAFGLLVLVKLPQRETDRKLRTEPAKEGADAGQRGNLDDARRTQAEAGAI